MPEDLESLGERIAEQAAHLDAALHRLLTDLRTFDRGGGWHTQGARSCAHWLSWRVGWSLGTAREHLRVADQAATPVQNINAAETSFRNMVASNVTASATAAGVSLAAGLSSAYVPRNRTIASGPTTSGAQAMFLSRAVRRSTGGSFGAGLYELSSSSAGVALHYHDPVLGKIGVPPPAPAPFHTPLGDDMCGNAPSLIMDFCQSFVACAAYDLWC